MNIGYLERLVRIPLHYKMPTTISNNGMAWAMVGGTSGRKQELDGCTCPPKITEVREALQ